MRTVALVFIYTVIIILVTPVVLICMALGWRGPLVAIGRWAMALSRAVLGIRIEVEGREHIPRGQPAVYMANHLSFLDGPLLFLILPPPVRVILKKSIFRIPVVGFGMRFVGFIPVDRKGKEGGKKSILRAARMMKQRGYSFFMFPEGTRSRDGRLQAFRRGGFFLALEAQAPIAPVVIRGTFEIMPKGAFFVRRGTVRVTFLEPVPTAGLDLKDLDALRDAVRAALAAVKD
ncbi:MAG: lysophospholipid acyltransferase family protein [Acidobacteriota bacterium]|nr:lysophospholipid acyltransferase family protein [Acidobacteriota bacterium]